MDCFGPRGGWQQSHCYCQCKLWAPSASLECGFVPVVLVLKAGALGSKGQSFSQCSNCSHG